jgi:hypothetical protein
MFGTDAGAEIESDSAADGFDFTIGEVFAARADLTRATETDFVVSD